jgi:glycosyltransferase involved in cell wall biosynthesis
VKLSIITPCYNSEKFIEETIESVLNQKGNFEIEYIVVDGGSTDKTVAIIAKYEHSIESGEFPIKCNKVSLVHLTEKDDGMYDALTKGFKLATGDIIAYINSDDLYLPNAFSVACDIFTLYPDVDWMTGASVGCNEKGQMVDCLLPFKYRRDFIRKGFYGTVLMFIPQESTFWRRTLLDEVDFDLLKRRRFAGDFYLWHTFSKKTDLYIVQSYLGGFRSRSGQKSQQQKEYLKEFMSIVEEKAIVDLIFAYLYKVVMYFTPNVVKRILNNRIVYYDGSQWVMRSARTKIHMDRPGHTY